MACAIQQQFTPWINTPTLTFSEPGPEEKVLFSPEALRENVRDYHLPGEKKKMVKERGRRKGGRGQGIEKSKERERKSRESQERDGKIEVLGRKVTEGREGREGLQMSQRHTTCSRNKPSPLSSAQTADS